MLKLQARLRKLLAMPVIPADERAAFAADIDAARNMDDLALVSGRMMNAGARALERVADGVSRYDRVDAARIRAEAQRNYIPELDAEQVAE